MAGSQTNIKEPETDTSTTTGEPSQATAFSRDQIRSAILSAPAESEILSVFGVQVEIRAPALEDLMQYRDSANDDFVMARAIVNNTYVPKSDERVFDNADIPELMKAKFTKDMRTLNAAITRVLGGDDKILEDVDNQTKSN